MPNWCANSLKLTPKTDQAKELMAKIKVAMENRDSLELFNMIYPMPKELLNTVCGSVAEEERPAHEAQMKANIEKYGYPTWYEFAHKEWGTKWDACRATYKKCEGSLLIWFDTAWSPPLAIYEKLVNIGFEVEATFCEQGAGYAGIYRNDYEETQNISFYDEDDDEAVERMVEFFSSMGMQHAPQHLGG